MRRLQLNGWLWPEWVGRICRYMFMRSGGGAEGAEFFMEDGHSDHRAEVAPVSALPPMV